MPEYGFLIAVSAPEPVDADEVAGIFKATGEGRLVQATNGRGYQDLDVEVTVLGEMEDEDDQA